MRLVCNGLALFLYSALQSGTGRSHPNTKTTLRPDSRLQIATSVVSSDGCFGACPVHNTCASVPVYAYVIYFV